MDSAITPFDSRKITSRGSLRSFFRRLLRPEPPPPPQDCDIFTATRHITGAIGANTSAAYDALAKGADSFNRSLRDNPLPPSIHISLRDSTRHNIPVPLSERCLEDHQQLQQ